VRDAMPARIQADMTSPVLPSELNHRL
jgi:hypothetical protein